MSCSDVVFTAAFTIEAVLKIVAFGFKPYLSFFQNIIDILIVISSLVMLFLDTMAEISVIKVRAGRMQQNNCKCCCWALTCISRSIIRPAL